MATEKRVTLLEIDIDVNAVSKKQGDLLKQIQKLKDENKELSKSTDKLTTANSKQAQAYAKNKAEISKLSQDSRTYNKILNDQSRAGEVNVKVINKTDGSVNSLRNALNVNRTVWKSLTKEQRENSEVGKTLTKTINEQDQEYKELSRSIGNNQVDVGNYKLATEDLLGSFNIMGTNVGQLVNQFKAKRTALKATAKGLKGTTKGLKLFRIALISTGIGAIVVALGTLIAAFSSTQSGMDSIRRAVAPLVGAFKGLIGVIQEISVNVFGGFSDEFIIQKNRIVAAILGIRIAFNDLTGDAEESKKLVEELKDVANEMEQAQARLNVRSGELGDIFSGAGKKIREAANRQQEIVELGIQAEETEIKNITLKSQLIAQQKEQNKLAEDQTKPLDVRLAGAKESIRLAQQQEEIELNLLDIRIQEASLKLKQNDSDREALKEFAELEAQRGEIKARITEFETTQQNKVNGIVKQVESVRKKNAEKRRKALEDELKLSQNLAEKSIEILERDLSLFVANNESKVKDTEKLSKDIIKIEEERLNLVFSKQTEINEKTKQAGLKALEDELKLKKISEEEAIKEREIINKDFLLAQVESKKENDNILLELNKTFNEQIKQDNLKKVEDEKQANVLKQQEELKVFQDKIARLQVEGATELELKLAQLELEKEQAIRIAKETGADVTKVVENNAKKEEAIRMAVENAKISAIQGALGQAKGFFEESSAAYKVLAIAEASIATYLAANKALALPPPANVIVPALTIATGLSNVAKIAAFADGTESTSPYGVVDLSSHTGTIKGTSNISRSNGDNMLATVRTGEAILNKEQQSKINSWLGFNGISKAVSGYADGTTFTSPAVSSSITRNVVNNTNVSSLDNSNNFKIELDVKDVVKATDDFNVKIQDATI